MQQRGYKSPHTNRVTSGNTHVALIPMILSWWKAETQDVREILSFVALLATYQHVLAGTKMWQRLEQCDASLSQSTSSCISFKFTTSLFSFPTPFHIQRLAVFHLQLTEMHIHRARGGANTDMITV